ncbi:MAG: aminotransferase class V-fold PLP-dependent enzyme [Clostridiales bacterium]|nr:aminotransferase class V-fold PLP-dependent enzyme [Clostridiales bacterium]
MIRFNNDYSEICHERILKRMSELSDTQVGGYGLDEYCDEARGIIKNLIGQDNADVHFLVGGTQANMTVIASVLRPHQCAVCASSGHINVHETGAVESTGHKVMSIPTENGKLTGDIVRNIHVAHWADFSHEHIAQPKLVYISDSTEIGTIYKKDELIDIYAACRDCGMYLFLDGARLGYALACEENDLDIKTIAENTDVFYIGGTKCGAMFGEAVVILNDDLKEDFRYIIKQKGGMLAKGWLLGIQFTELLKDGLYFELAKHADDMALKINKAVRESGYFFYSESPANQQFVIFPDSLLEKLNEKYVFEYQARVDETHSAERICTSWATKEENVDMLIADIKKS